MFRTNLAIFALFVVTAGARAGADSYFEEKVKDFGTVPRGPTLTHYFRLTNNIKENVAIAGVRVSCGCVSASVGNTSLKPGQSTSVTAEMDTRRFLGPKAVTVYVSFSAPQFEEVSLRVQANSREDFTMSPDTIAFSPVRFGHEAKASVQLSLLTDPNWQVTNPTCDSNYVKPTATLVKRNNSEVTYEVTATLRPDLPVGKWFTDVWVATNNASMPKLRIPLTVEILPALSATPSVVQFGEVKVGAKADQRLIVRADKPFKILEVKGVDGSVSVAGKEDDAKAVHILTFSFKPDRAGELTRTVRVVTDSGKDAELSVPLRGTAVAQ